MPKKPSKPHDEFFKATFGRLEIALDYVQKMLPAELVAELDTNKLAESMVLLYRRHSKSIFLI